MRTVARLDIKMPKEYIDTIEKLGTDDNFYKAVVSACKNPLKKQLKAALKKHRITGKLEKNVKAKSGKKYLYPAKKIAAHIEYGTSHQPPKPYVDMAARAAEAEATQAMQEAIDKKTKEMGL